MKIFIALMLFIILSSSISNAQIQRETRAVWLTTNFQLDWPPKTYDEEIQKNTLREIFKDLNRKKINTVYFQVRSNGTVFYNSGIEPFTPYLTGTVDLKPNYDPLLYAISLAKEFGMEIHAWINTIRCFSGSDLSIYRNYKHVIQKHPEWIVKVNEDGKYSYWLNPGIPAVKNYIVNLINEISSNYDIDGIHLDFFRYPGTNFQDTKEYKKYNTGLSRDDWRRNNLTAILEEIKSSVSKNTPLIKIGVAPIGIRKSMQYANGWEGYSQVYQDTEEWLKRGLVDYLAPQIYWNINDNPKFKILANDWNSKSYGKNIVLGVAAYKDDVRSELKEMIDYSREIKASGISFFRYNNINENDFNYYEEDAFPPPMHWKNGFNWTGINNVSFILESEKPLVSRISWININNSFAYLSPRYVTLYHKKGINNSEKKLLKLIDTDKEMIKLQLGKPKQLAYYFELGSINRLWDENPEIYPLEIVIPYLNNLKGSINGTSEPVILKDFNDIPNIIVKSFFNQEIKIIFEFKNGSKYVQNGVVKMGVNIFSVSQNLGDVKIIKIQYAESNEIDEIIIPPII